MIGQAAALFVSTNVDSLIVMAVLFAAAGRDHAATRRVVLGLYLGFGVVVLASLLAARLARHGPRMAVGYLGLIPLLLGIRFVLQWRRAARAGDSDGPVSAPLVGQGGLVTGFVLALANGTDNFSVYASSFALATEHVAIVSSAVFVLAFAPWCGLARALSRSSVAARAVSRVGTALLPAVLMGAGLRVLVHPFAALV